MELFEFLMILVSIIIGLGVAEVLSGAARLLRVRDDVAFYWIHSLFQVGIFAALLQLWWESWDYRTLSEITFVQAGVLLLAPVIVFMIAHLLYPDPVRGEELRSYYFRQVPLLWGLVAVGTAVGTFLKPAVFGDPILQADNLSGFLMIPLATVLAASRSERIHAVAASTLLAVLLLDILLPGWLISG